MPIRHVCHICTGIRRLSLWLWRDRSANVAIVFALCLVPLLLAGGGAIDFSRYYGARQEAQDALDAAVLAGAAKNSAAVAADTFNAWKVDLNGSVITATSSDFSGCTSSSATCSGTIKATMKTTLLPTAGISSLPLTLTASAARGTSANASGPCIWLTGYGFWTTGKLNAPTCEVEVLNGSATMYWGSGTITSKLCLARGVAIGSRDGSIVDSSGSASLSLNCSTTADPYAGKYADPSHSGCNHNYFARYSSVTLYPGVYCGGMTFTSGTVTFSPGVYIIRGGVVNFYSGVRATGAGVVFYFADTNSYMTVSSNATASFTAPTTSSCGIYNGVNSCDYTGVLMFEPRSLSYQCSGLFGFLGCVLLPWTTYGSTFALVYANGSLTTTGLIYLPSRRVTINDTLTNHGGMVLGGMVIYSGTVVAVDGGTSADSGAVRLSR